MSIESAQPADEWLQRHPDLVFEFQVSRGPVSQDGIFDEASGATQSRRYTDAGEQELSPSSSPEKIPSTGSVPGSNIFVLWLTVL
ncbi:hypothetical protein J7T55_012113 [Diaporthe amygdali]|uniref:uncharacterized protein n=1 Tax=Phomopsis amygdali TaxID=1214568 RepID=UPI0022FF0DA4|nr:uncharacterized protein J7T55_012113 [Diaporthe amygdali]KAJ0123647.1 hypothetical protein J7T55_012113 [Diaporthe amygdali]